MTPVVQARELTKVYRRGTEQVRALDGVSFEILPGELVAVVGPSGSGKTTLLNLLGCLDVPTSGELRLEGEETRRLTDRALTRLRRERIGFVFQHFGLIPSLTVAENIALPALFARRRAKKRVDDLLQRVGLEHRRDHRPNQLSGGEMQRVAIARALVNEPRLLLADEPTGNLDSATGGSVIELLKTLHQGGLTVIVVTHNDVLAAGAQRRLRMADGKITEAAAATGEP
ncbi:MAG: ABC transporter ATP-binding protein [Armatimonadota bacterium]